MQILFPIIIGAVGILQGGFNKKISATMGVAQATMLGSILTFIMSIGFYMYVKSNPSSFESFVQVKASLFTFKWWYVFPAFFGIIIVAGLPIAIAKLGAVKMTIALVGAQMVTSVLWDIFIEKIPMNFQKSLGALLAIISVLLVTGKISK